MNEFKLTEKMVLALLGKGMKYEIEDMDMEYEINVPLGIFGIEEDSGEGNMGITIKMHASKIEFEIQKD